MKLDRQEIVKKLKFRSARSNGRFTEALALSPELIAKSDFEVR